MGPERKIQDAVVKYAKSRGVVAVKQQAGRFGSAGWPDYFFFYNGRVMPIEFKAPGKKLTPLQDARCDELDAVGIPTYRCDNVDLGKGLVERFMLGGP